MKIAQVWKCKNGMVVVFDENGKQMSDYQGRYGEVADSIRQDADEQTRFLDVDWYNGIQTPIKKSCTFPPPPTT